MAEPLASSPTPTTSSDATSSSAGPTWLGQGGAGSNPDQPDPPGSPPPPPPQPEQPAEGGDDPARNGGDEGEPAPLDEEAYAGLSVGDDLVVDEAALGDFRKLAAEARIPPAAAQKLLDLHGQLQARAQRDWQAMVHGWGKAAEADPYLAGGDVANGGFASFRDARAAAGHFMSRFGDTELRQALDAYGLGNHPALLRALAKAGRELAADTLHAGNARPRVDPLRAMYPSMSDEFFPH